MGIHGERGVIFLPFFCLGLFYMFMNKYSYGKMFSTFSRIHLYLIIFFMYYFIPSHTTSSLISQVSHMIFTLLWLTLLQFISLVYKCLDIRIVNLLLMTEEVILILLLLESQCTDSH